jgi:hypothetical protein
MPKGFDACSKLFPFTNGWGGISNKSRREWKRTYISLRKQCQESSACTTSRGLVFSSTNAPSSLHPMDVCSVRISHGSISSVAGGACSKGGRIATDRFSKEVILEHEARPTLLGDGTLVYPTLHFFCQLFKVCDTGKSMERCRVLMNR